MRKLLAFAFLFSLVGNVYARQTGATSSDNDAACWGAAASEVCIDSSGNVIPTTDDNADLGTSSLEWQDAYFDGTVTTDALTNSGTTTMSGNVVNGSDGDDTWDINHTSAAVDAPFGLNLSTTTDGSGTSILFIDGANQRVGVNTTGPSTQLHVAGTTPVLTVGDAGAEDTQINIVGDALSYSVGFNNTTNVFNISTGTTLNSGTALSINSSADVTISNNATLGGAVTDIITFTGLPRLPTNATPRSSVTPTAAGELIWNSGSSEVCVSTGTTMTTWVQVADGTTACQN